MEVDGLPIYLQDVTHGATGNNSSSRPGINRIVASSGGNRGLRMGYVVSPSAAPFTVSSSTSPSASINPGTHTAALGASGRYDSSSGLLGHSEGPAPPLPGAIVVSGTVVVSGVAPQPPPSRSASDVAAAAAAAAAAHDTTAMDPMTDSGSHRTVSGGAGTASVSGSHSPTVSRQKVSGSNSVFAAGSVDDPFTRSTSSRHERRAAIGTSSKTRPSHHHGYRVPLDAEKPRAPALEPPPRRACGIPLGAVIGLFCGCLLAVVAVVTFQTVYDASLKAINDVGVLHARQIGDTVATRFGSQINATTAAMTALQLAIARNDGRAWTLPDDFDAATAAPGETWHARWMSGVLDSAWPLLVAISSLIFRLADNSWVTASLRSPSYIVYARAGRSDVAAGLTSEVLYDIRNVTMFTNGTVLPPTHPLSVNAEPTPPVTVMAVGGDMWRLNQQIAAEMNYGLDQLNSADAVAGIERNVTKGAIFFNEAGTLDPPIMASPVKPRGIWMGITTVPFVLSGELQQFIIAPICMPIINASRQMIGTLMVPLNLLNLIQPIIADISAQLPQGSAVFVVDMAGFLLGSTTGTIFEVKPRVIGALVPDNCAYTDSADVGATKVLNCRYKAIDYNSALRAAGQRFLLAARPQAARLRAADKEEYYVAAVPLTNSFDGFSMSVATVIRQTAIIGEVSKTRSNNIGIVAGCVAVSFVLAVIVVWALLAPLRQVASRMDLAAALEDDDAAGTVSLMSEVAALQHAYFAMNAELQRLKGFVPQSVLLQNVHRRRVLRKKSLLASRRANPDLTWWERLQLALSDSIFDDLAGYDGAAVVASGRGLGDTPYQADSEEEGEGGGGADGKSDAHSDARSGSVSGRGSSGGNPTPSESSPAAPLRTRANSVISVTKATLAAAACNTNNNYTNAANTVVPGVVHVVGAPPGPSAMASGGPGRLVGTGITGPRFAPGHHGVVDGLAARTVSVVCVNAMGFHSATLRDGAARLAVLAEQLTTAVVSAAAEERGVVDSFHGDHFLLTFNAAASCATHAVRAPRCALYIGQEAATAFAFINDGFGYSALTVTAGVASGHARCGALGSRDSRRFSVVGAVVPQAFALEQLVRRHDHDGLWRRPVDGPYRIAVAQPLFEDLRSQFVYECVDVAPLPVVRTASSIGGHHSGNTHMSTPDQHGPRPKAPTAIYAIGQLLDEVDENEQDMEWMYAMNAAGVSGDAAGAQHPQPPNAMLAAPPHVRGASLSGSRSVSASHYGSSAMDAATPAAGPAAASVDHDPPPADAAELLAIMGVVAPPQVTASPISGAVGGGTPAPAPGHLPLPENNRAYMLIATVAAAARTFRDAEAAAAAAAVAESQQQQQQRSTSTDRTSSSHGMQGNNQGARHNVTRHHNRVPPARASSTTGPTGPTFIAAAGNQRSNVSAAAPLPPLGASALVAVAADAVVPAHLVTAVEDVPLGAAGVGVGSPNPVENINGPLTFIPNTRHGSFGAAAFSDPASAAPSRCQATTIVASDCHAVEKAAFETTTSHNRAAECGGSRQRQLRVGAAPAATYADCLEEDQMMLQPGIPAATTVELAAASKHNECHQQQQQQQPPQRTDDAAALTTDIDDEEEESDPDWCWTRYVPDELSRQQLLATLRRTDPVTRAQVERIRNLLFSLTR